MTYYFLNKDSERCYEKNYFLDQMWYQDFKELKVFKAIKSKDKDFFFCKHFDEVGETGNCGKECSAYSPRNGKSGICKHHGFCYEAGESVTLKTK